MSDFVDSFNKYADAWAAAGTLFAVFIAIVAALIAWGQAREARSLRIEQAQPYVVAFMEPSVASPRLMDIVLRNYGTTVARDVTLEATPKLQRTPHPGKTEPEDVKLFEVIPTFAPGQEYRVYWDNWLTRKDREDLVKRHEITVRFKDSKDKAMEPSHSIFDWTTHSGRQWVTIRGMHDAAKALMEISSTVKEWREGPTQAGLKVFVRDGDAKDERRRQEFEAWRAAEQRLEAEEAEQASGETEMHESEGGSTESRP